MKKLEGIVWYERLKNFYKSELIADGKMSIKVLKSRPKIETPFKCYISED